MTPPAGGPGTARWDWIPRPGASRPVTAGVLGGAALITVYYLLPLKRLTGARPALDWSLLIVVLSLAALLTVVQALAAAQGVPRAMSFGLPMALCLVIVVFAGIYFVLARQDHHVEGLSTKTDALYFTVTTLSTVGYGDIHAASQGAKIVVILQILFDVILIGGAIGSLKKGAERYRQERSNG